MHSNKQVVVTGGSGQLGQSIKKIQQLYPELDLSFPDRTELDLSQLDSIEHYFDRRQTDLIINCAAYTAVDKAEAENDLAQTVNHHAVKALAEIAARRQSKFIHISTDYVFDGQQHRPYIESDIVSPQSMYGATKLAGEQALHAVMAHNAIIIRTSWVYSEFGYNFVKTMRRLGRERDSLGVVFDQVGTPTYAGDLAKIILDMVVHEQFKQSKLANQIYHYSNEGVCSWYDFAKAIFELDGIECHVDPIESRDYPTPAVRPHFSVLNKTKIKHAYDFTIPYWRDALTCCLAELKQMEA